MASRFPSLFQKEYVVGAKAIHARDDLGNDYETRPGVDAERRQSDSAGAFLMPAEALWREMVSIVRRSAWRTCPHQDLFGASFRRSLSLP